MVCFPSKKKKQRIVCTCEFGPNLSFVYLQRWIPQIKGLIWAHINMVFSLLHLQYGRHCDKRLLNKREDYANIDFTKLSTKDSYTLTEELAEYAEIRVKWDFPPSTAAPTDLHPLELS